VSARAAERIAGALVAVLLLATPAGAARSSARHAEPSHAGAWHAASALSPGGVALAAAEGDTSLDRFLTGLSDSTDRYFGETAARRDTSGLDSALVYGLAHPAPPLARRLPLRPTPEFAFNRVDGPVWGGRLGLDLAPVVNRLGAWLGWAAGPNRLLGEGTLAKRWPSRIGDWHLHVRGGRTTAVMDRTDADHRDEQVYLSTLRALIGGHDRQRYLRHDGWEARLEQQGEWWRATLGYRDMLESPLPTTATWTLLGPRPELRENLAAAFGRAREAQYEVAFLLPGLPIQSELQYQTSGRTLGSDFTYRRTRAAIAATLGLGRHVTLLPQAAYGRLTGQPVPQSAFYLGGSGTLRSVEGAALGGTGFALARLELVGTDDVLTLARIPHPAWLPLQLGAFASSGAVWGADPYGGPGTSERDWPGRERWLPEAGVSLLYQPGLPDPTSLLRVDWAMPFGPRGRESRLSFGYTRAVALLRPLR
jgi:hypothetical protein